jgi:hypothetical protein
VVRDAPGGFGSWVLWGWEGVGVARSYRPVDRAQEFLLPPSMLDWLPEDHLVWFVMAAVERLDTRVHTSREPPTRTHMRLVLGRAADG